MAAFYVNVFPVFTIIDKKLNMKCSRVKATSCGKYVNMMCVIDWNSLRLEVGFKFGCSLFRHCLEHSICHLSRALYAYLLYAKKQVYVELYIRGKHLFFPTFPPSACEQ